MDKDINVCCCFLGIVDCGDSEEHKHLACFSPNIKGELPECIPNEHIKNHCIGESFEGCIYYPSKNLVA